MKQLRRKAFKDLPEAADAEDDDQLAILTKADGVTRRVNVDTLSRGPKGDKGDTGNVGPVPAHSWDGAQLRFEGPSGWGPYADLEGPQGPQGQQGGKGETGDTGPKPDHQWSGTQLRFETPSGWGPYTDLKGDKGDKGDTGGTGPKGEDSTVPGPIGGTGPVPSHQWSGTQLRFEGVSGWGSYVDLKGDTGATGAASTVPGPIGPDGPQGIQGDKGNKGDTGDTGPRPDHTWSGTQLRFQTATGAWGDYTDLKGAKGDTGAPGQDGAQGDTGPAGTTNYNDLDNKPAVASAAQIRSLTTAGIVTPEKVRDAAANVTTSATSLAPNFEGMIGTIWTINGNRTLSNPTNIIPGKTVSVTIKGNNTAERTISFGSYYKGDLPDVKVTNTSFVKLFLNAESTTEIIVSAVEWSS